MTQYFHGCPCQKEEVHINTRLNPSGTLSAQLFDAVLSLKTKEECRQFFADICTDKEIKALAQRLEVARLLKEGAIYEEIVDKTGASTATISRVKRSLNCGANGYITALSRL